MPGPWKSGTVARASPRSRPTTFRPGPRQFSAEHRANESYANQDGIHLREPRGHGSLAFRRDEAYRVHVNRAARILRRGSSAAG